MTKPLKLKPPSKLLSSPQSWLRLSPHLPSSSGVYWLLDQNKRILYVGKAKNLKHRLYSYTKPDTSRPTVTHFLPQIKYTQYQKTPSEYIALLLEAEMVRVHQPPANSLLKDDKSAMYIGITKAAIPQIITLRKLTLEPIKPTFSHTFGPFTSGYMARHILKTMRRILPYCSATPAQLARKKPCFYLHLGQCPGVCIGSMDQPAYRQRVRQIILFLKGQHAQVATSIKSSIKQASQNRQYEQAHTFKLQYQALLALSQVSLTDLNALFTPANSADQALKSLTQALINTFQLPKEYPLKRIEMYDVSNLKGDYATASLVVATNGKLDPHQYRYFYIKTLNVPNDPAMLQEAVSRRFKHREWPYPSLLLVDGGKSQINRVRQVVPGNIPVLGLAKHPDRLIGYNAANRWLSVPIKDQPFVTLVTRLRDESHRFARKLFHHKLKKAYTNNP